jgi:hypothetical protein
VYSIRAYQIAPVSYQLDGRSIWPAQVSLLVEPDDPGRTGRQRPIKSVALPAAADTIMVTGRMGYACALAIRDTAGSTAAAAVRLDGEVSLRAPEAHSDLRLAARITLPHFSVS